MKFVIRDLKLGESVTGRVEECLPGNEFIICIDGDLLRVHNDSSRNLKPGDQCTLVVKATQPLRFQLIEDRAKQRRRGSLDVNI